MKLMFFRKPAVIALIILASIIAGCSFQDSKPIHLTGFTMGTSYNVKLLDIPAGIAKQQIQRDIELLLKLINSQMSTYLAESEISKFNQSTVKTPVPVSQNTLKVLALAQEISLETNGGFDVTVGPLVNLWGFGPKFQADSIPSVEKIEAALRMVNFSHISLDFANQSLSKNSELYADLSAIAKGFAVDEIARYLQTHGMDNYLIEIGGEVRLNGVKNGSGWRLAVEKPVSNERTVHAIISASDKAIATSGDYRNFFELDGVRYSHTINPSTGFPVKQDVLSVTVIAGSCAEADAYATAFSVIGPSKAIEVANRKGLAVLLLVKDGNGYKEIYSDSFNQFRVQ